MEMTAILFHYFDFIEDKFIMHVCNFASRKYDDYKMTCFGQAEIKFLCDDQRSVTYCCYFIRAFNITQN